MQFPMSEALSTAVFELPTLWSAVRGLNNNAEPGVLSGILRFR